MPVRGLSKLTFAIERPGASNDQGIYKDRIELTNVKSRFPLPDFSAEYRSGHNWGYIELAGMLRYIKWEDQNNFPVINLSGSAVGWGLNLSSNVKLNKSSVLKSAFIYGAGVENYMNDGPVDISIKNQFGNSRAPIKGVALPLFGLTAFLDHDWNDKFSSTIGYSMVKVNNTDAQSANSLKKGSYALTNLLYKPVENVLTGVELQWIERKNYIDNGFDSHSIKIQFSFKYSFSQFLNKSK